MLLFDIGKNIVFLDVETATELMRAVARGEKILQMICSPSGFGKTSIATKELRRNGIVQEKPHDPLPRRGGRYTDGRPTKPIALARKLWHCHLYGIAVLLLDDPGNLAVDVACCDILKFSFGVQRTCSLETPEITRNFNWKTAGSARYDPSIPDPKFSVALLRLLWLCNTDYTNPTILARLGDHFAPLITRGLNPFWIRDDRENDNYDLFLYCWWLATERHLLRGLGFPYKVNAQAVNWYLAHGHDLVDLAPRTMERIARAFCNPVARARDAELTSMLSKRGDLRPKLKLPTSWIQVIDGVPTGELVWP